MQLTTEQIVKIETCIALADYHRAAYEAANTALKELLLTLGANVETEHWEYKAGTLTHVKSE